MTTPGLGAPPPLRGDCPSHLSRFAIACRASALVLDLQGHPGEAVHLRAIATAADHRVAQIGTQDRPTATLAA